MCLEDRVTVTDINIHLTGSLPKCLQRLRLDQVSCIIGRHATTRVSIWISRCTLAGTESGPEPRNSNTNTGVLIGT